MYMYVVNEIPLNNNNDTTTTTNNNNNNKRLSGSSQWKVPFLRNRISRQSYIAKQFLEKSCLCSMLEFKC